MLDTLKDLLPSLGSEPPKLPAKRAELRFKTGSRSKTMMNLEAVLYDHGEKVDVVKTITDTKIQELRQQGYVIDKTKLIESDDVYTVHEGGTVPHKK